MKKKKEYKKRNGIFSLCLTEAHAFFETAAWCEHKNLDSEDMVSPYLFPFATNLAFACETYMKAIMIFYSKDDEFYEGHSLTFLFDKLPCDIRDSIEKEYCRNAVRQLTWLLETHSDTFIEWRYAFEEENDVTIHSTDLGVFANCLKHQCELLTEDIQ